MFPKCDLIYSPKEFTVPSEMTYEEFLNFIPKYVGADCWGLEFNTNEIFNSYSEYEFNDKSDKKFKELMSTIKGEKFYTNPSFFFDMYLDEDFIFNIYMFGSHPWKINFNYTNKKFHVSCFKSHEFNIAYPNN
jgi:hypothetical protein